MKNVLNSIFSATGKLSSKRVVGVPFGLALIVAFLILVLRKAEIPETAISLYKYTLPAVFGLLGLGIADNIVNGKNKAKDETTNPK